MSDNPSYDYDIEVQKKLLSLLIFDESWARLQGKDILKPEYFDSVILRNICRWIINYQNKYKKSATKTVIQNEALEFTQKANLKTEDYYVYTDVIEEIFTLNDNDDLEWYKDKAIAFARKASYFNALMEAKNIFDKSSNYDDALKLFKDALAIGGDVDLGMDFEDVKFDFIDIIGETYSLENMLKTGIKGWDDALGGGFVKNNIHICAARPGGGKSKTMAFLSKQALLQRKKVIYITLELSEAETMANLVNSITGLTLYDLMKPENKREYELKVNEFSRKYAPNFKVKFYKPATVTADTIHNYIMKLINESEDRGEKFKPDVIFVDYLDKLLPTIKVKGNSYEDIGGVADDLKNLAISFDCPVITASQLGRFSWDLKDDQVISMSSIAESARKVHLAHSITTFNDNPAEKDLGKVRLYTAKSRSGTPGRVIWCHNDLGRCSMVEVEPWDPKGVYGSAGSIAANVKTSN